MNRSSHLMCKKWYQLITCTEPVGALNRRSFFMLKRPAPNHGCGSSSFQPQFLIFSGNRGPAVGLGDPSLSCFAKVFDCLLAEGFNLFD